MSTAFERVDALVNKRAAERAAANAAEDLWKGSIARHRDRKRQQNRWRWVRYFDRLAANHAAISADYERRAEALISGASAAKDEGE